MRAGGSYPQWRHPQAPPAPGVGRESPGWDDDAVENDQTPHCGQTQIWLSKQLGDDEHVLLTWSCHITFDIGIPDVIGRL